MKSKDNHRNERPSTVRTISLLGNIAIRTMRWELMKRRGIATLFNGTEIIIPCNGSDIRENGVSKPLMLDGIREPVASRVFMNNLSDGDVLMDIGSNIGYYVLLSGRAGMVYSIEPNLDNYRYLQANIGLNDLSENVKAFNFAVSNFDGPSELFVSHYSNLHGLEKSPKKIRYKGTQPVDVIKLDTFIRKEKTDVDFIRMDVEGHETDIIKGMKILLDSGKPLKMLIEMHQNIAGYDRIRAMLETIEDAGFSAEESIIYDTRLRDILGQTKVMRLSISDICKHDMVRRGISSITTLFVRG